MEPGQIWDEILASTLPTESTTESANASRQRRLALRREPNRKCVPSQDRSVKLIGAELRAKIRLLVSGEAPWPLVIVGGVGTGKTCAALSILDYAGGDYYTSEDLCQALIESQNGRLTWHRVGDGGTIWPAEFWARLERSALVVLDELGARDRVSDFAYNTVKKLIDVRNSRPLVCISNLTLSQLSKIYDDRLASRLATGTVVMLDGPDRRLEDK